MVSSQHNNKEHSCLEWHRCVSECRLIMDPKRNGKRHRRCWHKPVLWQSNGRRQYELVPHVSDIRQRGYTWIIYLGMIRQGVRLTDRFDGEEIGPERKILALRFQMANEGIKQDEAQKTKENVMLLRNEPDNRENRASPGNFLRHISGSRPSRQTTSNEAVHLFWLTACIACMEVEWDENQREILIWNVPEEWGWRNYLGALSNKRWIMRFISLRWNRKEHLTRAQITSGHEKRSICLKDWTIAELTRMRSNNYFRSQLFQEVENEIAITILLYSLGCFRNCPHLMVWEVS